MESRVDSPIQVLLWQSDPSFAVTPGLYSPLFLNCKWCGSTSTTPGCCCNCKQNYRVHATKEEEGVLRALLCVRAERDALNIRLEGPATRTKKVPPGFMWTIRTTSSVTKPTQLPYASYSLCYWQNFMTYWYTGLHRLFQHQSSDTNTHLTPRFRSMPDTKLSTTHVNVVLHVHRNHKAY